MDPTTRAIIISAFLGGLLVAAMTICSIWVLRGGPQRRSQVRQRAVHRAAPSRASYLPRAGTRSTGRRRVATPEDTAPAGDQPLPTLFMPIDRHLRKTL